MDLRVLKCFLIAVAVLIMSVPVGGDEDPSDPPPPQEKEYITTEGIFGLCAVKDGLNVGNVCFPLTSEENVSFEIDDDTYNVTRGMYRFFKGEMSLIAGPELLAEETFCTETEAEVPDEADFVMVFVDGHIPTWFICGEMQGSTTGTIIMTPF